MKNVILFGSIPMATKVLKLIIEEEKLNLIGVCCKNMDSSWRNELTVYDFCQDNNIKIMTHEEVINSSVSLDIGFSIRYHKILSEELINKFSIGIINVHGGILPFYRGTYANIHAIINDEDEYGVTLHFIDPGVDTGDIIDIKRVKISDEDSGFDLYLKSEKLGYDLIKDNLKNIANDNIETKKQEKVLENSNKKAKTYKIAEINNLKRIEFQDLNTERSLRIIRAFDSPYHEPAFTYINEEKIYLRYKYNGYDKDEN